MARLYDRLPVFAQNLVCDAYGVKMRRERFGAPFERKLAELLVSEWWTEARIAEHQDTLVRDQVRHAFDQVPFYRDRWRAAGIAPDDIRGVADLPLLPITTKADVRAYATQMRATMPQPAPWWRCIRAERPERRCISRSTATQYPSGGRSGGGIVTASAYIQASGTSISQARLRFRRARPIPRTGAGAVRCSSIS